MKPVERIKMGRTPRELSNGARAQSREASWYHDRAPWSIKVGEKEQRLPECLSWQSGELPASLASYPDLRSGNATEVRRYWRNVSSTLFNHLLGLSMLIGI